MFYRLFRTLVSVAFRLFFKIDRTVDPHQALSLSGSVIFVGNHPNGLIDPGLFFVLTDRQLTFLAKAPLFKMPILGSILRGLDALPVFRKQDNADTSKNEGSLNAAIDALVANRAITLFPEGKSHSEPQLSDLKTGCARIALEAVRRGANVRIVPVGFTYEAKQLYRSRVHVEVGQPFEARAFLEQPNEDPHQAAVRLTDAIADSLRAVTLNLERWEDLPIVETAEALYALAKKDDATDGAKRAFARGMTLVRTEQPERFKQLNDQLAAFRRRLDLVHASPEALTFEYQGPTVAWFIVRNVLWLLTLPLFVLGMALFIVPYYGPISIVHAMKPEDDVESTVKVLAVMVIAPCWWALLTVAAWWWFGLGAGLLTFATVPPLALFTRTFYERRSAALRDARLFFVLGSSSTLKAQLLEEGLALAAEIDRLAAEYGPRVGTTTAS